MAPTGPLHGLRVIETGGFSTAFAGRLLAEAGADVVRVVDTEDPLATEAPFFGSTGHSIQEAWYNAGKRVIGTGVANGAGRGQFLSLLGSADILLEDWTPGSWPLSHADVSSSGVRAHVSVTPMGQTGPRATWKVPDLVANALSGSASVTGNGDSGPISGYGNQTHHTVGLYAAICALAGHRAARATRQYQHIDLSAHEALVSCTEQVLMEWFFPNGTWNTPIAPRQGSLHWSGAYEVYPGADGHGVMVTAALKFVDVLLPWLIEDGAAQDLGDSQK